MVGPIVITLRESRHWEQRNSNVKAWIEFAQNRKAEGFDIVFVRDTAKADEPIYGFRTFPEASRDIAIRMALYERAFCNLMVANGPAALTILGNMPWMMFKPLVEGWRPGTREWWRDLIRVPEGQQFPWSSPAQRIVWADDTLENIEAAWREHYPAMLDHHNVERGHDAERKAC